MECPVAWPIPAARRAALPAALEVEAALAVGTAPAVQRAEAAPPREEDGQLDRQAPEEPASPEASSIVTAALLGRQGSNVREALTVRLVGAVTAALPSGPDLLPALQFGVVLAALPPAHLGGSVPGALQLEQEVLACLSVRAIRLDVVPLAPVALVDGQVMDLVALVDGAVLALLVRLTPGDGAMLALVDSMLVLTDGVLALVDGVLALLA